MKVGRLVSDKMLRKEHLSRVKRNSSCSLQRMKKSSEVFHLLRSQKTKECSWLTLLAMRDAIDLKAYRSVTIQEKKNNPFFRFTLQGITFIFLFHFCPSIKFGSYSTNLCDCQTSEQFQIMISVACLNIIFGFNMCWRHQNWDFLLYVPFILIQFSSLWSLCC